MTTLLERIAAMKAAQAAILIETMPVIETMPKAQSSIVATAIDTALPNTAQESDTKIVQKKRSLADILAEKAQAAKTANTANTIGSNTQAVAPKITLLPAMPSLPSTPSPVEDREEIEDKEETEETENAGETFSLSISLNEQQILARDFAFSGKNFVLTGAAGTGKTTAQREIAAALIRQDALSTHTFRIQGSGERVEAPSIAFVAYTRIASGNLKRAIHKDPYLKDILGPNITTVHNLLEFQPEFFWDNEKQKESMRFTPMRNAMNPLDITHLIIEEATMIDIPLWRQIFDALRENVQIIFIGDINQLQPVFGASIFNYALASLPVIELTHVYRQKEGSSILDNAHKILAGEYKMIEDENFKIIRGGDVQHTQHKLMQSLSVTLPKWYAAGEYDPEQDIILSPWNKQDLGTDSINKVVSQFLGDEREAVVYEIVAGMNKLYLAVGDKVMYNKQVGIIKKIARNGQYTGKAPKTESKNLLRFGAYRGAIDTEGMEDFELAGYENLSLESLMEEEAGEKKKQASHLVDIELETGEVCTCSAVGDFSPQVFSLGYALTVHKAQGCEWRKVFFILHKDHSISSHRELLYTAVTRAREQFVAITKDFMIQKAVENQKVKGNNILEKIAYFNSGIKNFENVSFTKTC